MITRPVWCAPGDDQQDVWLLRFDDPSRDEMIWFGDGAETEARMAWESLCGQQGGAWNGHLFRLAKAETT